MPIYEYECRKCGHRFDVMQSFSDPPPASCGNNGCRGKVRKVISPPAVIFKGSGFYVTDYGRGRNGADSKPPKSESEPAAPSTDTAMTTEAAKKDG